MPIKPILLGNGEGKTESLVGTASGQTPVWSTTADTWVPGTPASSGGGGLTWFFNRGQQGEAPIGNLPTGVGGLTARKLDATAEVTQTSITATNVSPLPDDPTFVAGFVTNVGVPGITGIPAGLWEFNIWAQSTGGTTNQNYLQIKILKDDGTTVPNPATPIAQSDQAFMFDPDTITQYTISVLIPAGVTLLETDRIFIAVFAGSQTTNRDVTLWFGDSTPTHVHTSIAVPVDLTTDVNNILPIANGGTGVGTSGGTVNALANTVFAAPNGSNGQPSFRPLVAADIAGITPYDLRNFFVGTPGANAVIDRFIADRAFDFSTTASNHKFTAAAKTAGADVTITVKRTRSGSTVDVLTATSTSADTASNGYYPMAVTGVGNTDVAVGDVIEFVMGNAVNASFSTPMWTVYGTA